MNGNTFEGDDSSSKSGGYSAAIVYNSQITINDGKFTGGGFQVGYSGAKLILKNTNINITSTNTSNRHCVYATDGAYVEVNGGTFTFDTTKKRSYFYATNATIIVNDCTCGKAPTHKDWKDPIYEASGGQVIIRGGRFGFDPTNWVDEGYEAVTDGKEWVVRPKQ